MFFYKIILETNKAFQLAKKVKNKTFFPIQDDIPNLYVKHKLKMKNVFKNQLFASKMKA